MESFHILIFLLFFGFIFSIKNPAYGFMIVLFFVLDIGNYLSKNTFGLPNVFQIRDVAFIMLFIIIFFGQIKDKSFWRDHKFRNLLLFVSLFALYQIFVCILIHLNPTPYEFLRQIVYHRWRIFGIFITVPTYIIFRHNAEKIFSFIIISSFIVLSLYYISVSTPLNLIGTISIERFRGTEMIRSSFLNYGYIQMVILIALSVFILKIKYKYKKILFISAILMIIAQLLTLSRLMNFTMITSILLFAIIIKKFTGVSFTRNLRYLFIFSLIVLIISFIFFPNMPKNFYRTFANTFLELTGQVPLGTYQSRTEYELINVMPLIKRAPYFGIGYQSFMWQISPIDYGTADIPLLANLAMYGSVGLFIFSLIYLLEFKRIRNFYIFTKNNSVKIENKTSKIQLVFLLIIITYFFNNFFRLFYLTSELVSRPGMIMFGFYLGILFGLVRLFEENYIVENKLK
ncbi:MAG: O-antigen ligase family protein [Methanosarcinales archaeon]